MNNAVSGTTSGSLSLTQNVTAGSGSSVFGDPGSADINGYAAGGGGSATSYLTPSTSTASSLVVSTSATGGGGGYIDGEGGTPGYGGAATAESVATDSAGSSQDSIGAASATATAAGGSGGTAQSAAGLGGNALASATANSSNSSASAAANAQGGASSGGSYGGAGGYAQAYANAAGATVADAVATAHGGYSAGGNSGSAAAGAYAAVTGDSNVGLKVSEQTVHALGGSTVSGTVTATASAHASVAGTIPTASSASGNLVAAYATTSPSASVVSSATSGATNVQSAFASPTKVLGMFTVGAGAPSLGTLGSSPSTTLEWTISGSAVGSSEDLLFGFFGPSSTGSGSVTFSVTDNGSSAISESFSSFSSASAWFTDNVENLGPVTAGSALTLDVALTVDPTTSGAWFGGSGIFGLSDPPVSGPMLVARAAPVPEPGTISLLALAGLALPLLMRGNRREPNRRMQTA